MAVLSTSPASCCLRNERGSEGAVACGALVRPNSGNRSVSLTAHRVLKSGTGPDSQRDKALNKLLQSAVVCSRQTVIEPSGSGRLELARIAVRLVGGPVAGQVAASGVIPDHRNQIESECPFVLCIKVYSARFGPCTIVGSSGSSQSDNTLDSDSESFRTRSDVNGRSA